MAELHLYVSIPKSGETKKVSNALFEVLRMVDKEIVQITWIAERGYLTFPSLLWLSSILMKISRKYRDITFVNTIECHPKRSIPIFSIFVLHRFRFRYAFHKPTINSLSISTIESKLLTRLNVEWWFIIQDHGICDWHTWLKAENYNPILPFADYLKVYYGNNPLSCHYNSCLGRTIHITTQGELSICPYIQSGVRLNDLCCCESINDLFVSEQYIELLKGQIQRRNSCRGICPYFTLCKGGCPLCKTPPCPESEMLQALESVGDIGVYIKNPVVYEEEMLALSRSFLV